MRLVGGIGSEFTADREIPGERFLHHLRHETHMGKLFVRYQATRVRREIQQPVAIAAYGCVVEVNQLRSSSRRFRGGPEPAMENGNVDFRWIPPKIRTRCELREAAEIPGRHVRPSEGIRFYRQGNNAPLGGAANPVFVANPTCVRPFAKNDRVRLQLTDQVVPCGIVISFRNTWVRIRAIEPDFANRPVFGQQFVKLIEEVAIVVIYFISEAFETRCWLAPPGRVRLEASRIGRNDRTDLFTSVSVVATRIPGVRSQLVKVGGRKVNSQLDAVFVGCIGNLSDQVTLPSPPWAGRNRMIRVASRPQGKPVVVLADQDHHFAAAIFDGADPLVRIECRRAKYRWIFTTIAPLHAPERIRAEVDKERPLQPHPFLLIGARQDLRGFFGNYRAGIVAGNVLQRGKLNRSRRRPIRVRRRLCVSEGKNTE